MSTILYLGSGLRKSRTAREAAQRLMMEMTTYPPMIVPYQMRAGPDACRKPSPRMSVAS